MDDEDIERVIARLRSGGVYAYESYVAGIRERLEAHEDGFRQHEWRVDGDDRVLTWTEAEFRAWLERRPRPYLVEWVGDD